MQARMKQMRRRWRGVIFFSSEIILIFSSNLRGIGTYFVGRAVSTKSIAHEIIISSDIFGTKEVIWTIFRNKDNISYVTLKGNRIKIKVMDQMFLVGGFKNHNIHRYLEWVMHRPKKIHLWKCFTFSVSIFSKKVALPTKSRLLYLDNGATYISSVELLLNLDYARKVKLVRARLHNLHDTVVIT